MDVTSKAGLSVQPRHRQEIYDEPTSDVEFGDILGHLQFSAGAVQGLEGFVAPTNERTVGMERYEHVDSGSDDGKESNELIATHSEGAQNNTDDDVEQAAHLLSDRSKIRSADKVAEKVSDKHVKTDGVESVDKEMPKVEQIAQEQLQVEQDLTDLQHLASDHHQTVAEKQVTPQHPEQWRQKQINSNKQRRDQGVNTQLIESEGGEPGDAELQPERVQRVVQQQTQTQTVKGESEVAKHDTKPEISIDEGLLQDAESMVDKPSAKKSSVRSNRVEHVDTIIDKVSQTIGLAGSGAASAAQTAGASVKLSAQGRTIGNLTGVGLTKGKTMTKQGPTAAELTRSKAPTPQVELPEDVDKLSIIRQVSDEMKLRFGKNQHVEINLNPAELGRVRIQLQMQSDNSVNLRVSAEHAVIADLLHLNLNQLRKDLLAQGVQVNHVEVNADAHGQGGKEHSAQDDSSEGHSGDDPGAQENDDGQRRQFSVQA